MASRCFSDGDLGYLGRVTTNRGRTHHASEKGHDDEEESGPQRSEDGQPYAQAGSKHSEEGYRHDEEEGGSQYPEDGQPYAQAGSKHSEEGYPHDERVGDAGHKEGDPDDP
jgi:hypothetical protein